MTKSTTVHLTDMITYLKWTIQDQQNKHSNMYLREKTTRSIDGRRLIHLEDDEEDDLFKKICCDKKLFKSSMKRSLDPKVMSNLSARLVIP